jgi:hypothetical protein
LLSYKIFPEPKETSTLIFKEFGQRYQDAIEKRLASANAHDCPTTVEIERNIQGATPGQSGSEAGRSTSRSSEVDATIIDALCKAKARSSYVYANPTDIAGYEYWEKYEYTGMEQAVQDCWFWQLGYWVIEDVVDTITMCNSGSGSIFESPVKRLLYIDFAGRDVTGSRKNVRPSYIIFTDKDVVTLPFTGRVSNDDIDVLNFEFAVIVRTKEILSFMKELCSSKSHKFSGFFNELTEQTYKHNQITILRASIESLDLQGSEHNLYRYGDDAVVKLTLLCEYIFERSGYEEIKSTALKPKTSGG